MSRTSRSIVLTVAFVPVFVAAILAAEDPFAGTWKLNLAKSSSAMNRSSVVVMKGLENGIECINDSVDLNGKATHVEWTARYDGRDSSVKGNEGVDSISLTRKDAHTVHFVQKKNGKQVTSGESVVSADGKTWTLTGKGGDADGQEFSFTAVFDRQ